MANRGMNECTRYYERGLEVDLGSMSEQERQEWLLATIMDMIGITTPGGKKAPTQE